MRPKKIGSESLYSELAAYQLANGVHVDRTLVAKPTKKKYCWTENIAQS